MDLYTLGLKRYRQCAFTLAEVLLTLTIIGVVAAMTIPALISQTTDSQYKTTWKNSYAILSQVITQLRNDQGGNLKDLRNTWGGIYKNLTPYLTTATLCGTVYNSPFPGGYRGDSGCTHTIPVYKDQSGRIIGGSLLDDGQFILANGVHVFMENYSTAHYDKQVMWVDVNGYAKDPNVLGRDLFGILVTDTNIFPLGGLGTGKVEGTCKTKGNYCNDGYDTGFYCDGGGCSSDYLLE